MTYKIDIDTDFGHRAEKKAIAVAVAAGALSAGAEDVHIRKVDNQ